MLTRKEIIDYRDILGFSLGQIEKDYIQHIFLINLYKMIGNELLFKGGTALQKCYGLNRFSEDLDFTLIKDISIEKILDKTIKSMTLFGCESENKKSKEDEVSTVYQIRSKGPLYDGTEKSLSYIRIEVSKRKDVSLTPVRNEVVPMYRDLPPYITSVMDPSEIMAEKIRAIMTRDRARDLYDLYFLIRKKIEVDVNLIDKKLSYYNKKFGVKEFFESVEKKKKIWDHELRQLISVVPKFQIVRKTIENWSKMNIKNLREL